MTTSEVIMEHIHSLPASSQEEVLDFVEFLKSRTGQKKDSLYHSSWQDFSLNSAMQGMEEETSPYVVADIKETP